MVSRRATTVIRRGAGYEEVSIAPMTANPSMATADTPARKSWKHDLAPYLEIDAARSLGQIASVVLPYLGIWVLAAVLRPDAVLAVGLGVVATVFLVRMLARLPADPGHNDDRRRCDRRVDALHPAPV